MGLRHYQIQVNVEYKGICLQGIADYTKKDYCGTAMTLPFNGIQTNDYSHIMFIIPHDFTEEEIRRMSSNSLIKAYEECLRIKQIESSEIIAMLNEANVIKDSANSQIQELINNKSVLKQQYHQKAISQTQYQTIVSSIKQQKYYLTQETMNSLHNIYQLKYGKSIVKNLETALEKLSVK